MTTVYVCHVWVDDTDPTLSLHSTPEGAEKRAAKELRAFFHETANVVKEDENLVLWLKSLATILEYQKGERTFSNAMDRIYGRDRGGSDTKDTSAIWHGQDDLSLHNCSVNLFTMEVDGEEVML